MPTIHKSHLVAYSCEQMYRLVDDIQQYQAFVPYCSSSVEHERTRDAVRATLTLSGGGIEKSFTTINRLSPFSMMEIILVDGPFKQLEGFWRFQAQPDDGCEVVLDLEFEFSSRLLAMMFGPIFHQIAGTLVDAFISRAEEVYGKI